MLLGLLAVGLAALVPAYLRAVDTAVVEAVGKKGPTLVNEAVMLIQEERIGSAELFLRAAREVGVPEHEKLARYLTEFKKQHPALARYGVPAPYLDPLFAAARAGEQGEPRVLDLMLPESARAVTLRMLRQSARPGVRILLANRELTRMTLFPPVPSASGQVLDTAILLTALLDRTDLLSDHLRQQIESLADAANRGKDTAPIEAVYLDVVSLARMLNWGQFTAFLGLMDSLETFREVMHSGVHSITDVAVLYAAGQSVGNAAPVARLLRKNPEKAREWINFSLRCGTDGVRLLLTGDRPLHQSKLRPWLLQVPLAKTVFGWLLRLTLALPWVALLLKYILWFDAAFCFVRGTAWLLPLEKASVTGPPVPQLGLYQQQILALLVLVLAITMGEPSLAQAPPAETAPLSWNLPVVSAAVGDKVNEAIKPIMDEINLIALGVFAVIQAALYVLNLIKLREVKRQNVPSDLKLRLLDNEEHMFDAGLYVGLGGTVLGLILPAFNVIQPSLMVAYASTLFGILFVSVLKICHVRPYRRSLILDSSSAPAGL